MGRRKFSPGDWGTIKYGEFAGHYCRISMLEKDGDYVVIPYTPDGEPGANLTLNARSLDRLPPLILTEEDIISLVRARTLYSDYKDRIFPAFNVRVGCDYELTAFDIRDALLRINSRKECLGAFKEWFWVILNILYDNLNIERRFNEDFFSDTPENDDEIFSVTFGLAQRLYWRLEERFGHKEDMEKFIIKFSNPLNWDEKSEINKVEEYGYKIVCDDIISRINVYEYNKGRPKSEWAYSSSQKRHIISSYEDENSLEGATGEAIAKYREFVEDLYNEGDVTAIRILAWGYYEGSPAFGQDWKMSEKYLLELFERTGDPFAANSLGYIYYYGRVNEGTPEYDKAYRFFSYGALAEIDESVYKTADLLISGRGTVKNIDMGLNMLVDGYRNAFLEFCDGFTDNKLADFALRMGNACRDGLIYGMNLRDAYKFYLEARYAIRARIERNEGYGDRSVEKNIEKEIEKIALKMQLDMNADTIKTDFPLYINQFFEDKFPIKVTINVPAGSNRGTLKIERFRPGSELVEQGWISEESEAGKIMSVPRVLVVYPELSYGEMVSELTYRLEGVTVARKNDNSPFFLADGFRRNEKTNALEFFAGGNLVGAIDSKWYAITVDKKAEIQEKGDISEEN